MVDIITKFKLMEGIDMKKSGKVINFDDSKVYVVISNKEFITLERNDITPVKGKIYTGVVYVDHSNTIKLFSIIIAISIIIITCIYFIFLSPRANIIVSLDSNIKIGINNNKIVNITDSGDSSIGMEDFKSIKGNELNAGLSLLLDTAFKKELIPAADEYSQSKIYIYIIKEHKKEPLNFDVFKEYAAKFNYEVIVNRNDNALPF